MDRTQWAELVKEQQSSGKSIAIFCRERGIKDNTFHYWLNKHRDRDGEFVQVSGRETVEMTLADGTLLKVPGSQVAG